MGRVRVKSNRHPHLILLLDPSRSVGHALQRVRVECVTLPDIASVEATTEPAHPLLRAAVCERLG